MVARLLIALLLPAAMLWLVDRPGWLQMLDTMVYDSVLPLAAPPPSPDILIIAIDERSLRELGRWPLAHGNSSIKPRPRMPGR